MPERQYWRALLLVLHAEVDRFHSASVIEEIKKTLQDREFIVFFYCNFRDERAMSAAAVIGFILFQLLNRLRYGTGRDLIQLVDDIVKGITEGTLVPEHARSITPFVSRAARQIIDSPLSSLMPWMNVKMLRVSFMLSSSWLRAECGCS